MESRQRLVWNLPQGSMESLAPREYGIPQRGYGISAQHCMVLLVHIVDCKINPRKRNGIKAKPCMESAARQYGIRRKSVWNLSHRESMESLKEGMASVHSTV